MDKGRTEQIIEKLIDSVENGQSVPFGAGKVAVNKDETKNIKYPSKFLNNTYTKEDKDKTQYNGCPDPPCQCAVLIVNRYTECGKYSDKYKQIVDT